MATTVDRGDVLSPYAARELFFRQNPLHRFEFETPVLQWPQQLKYEGMNLINDRIVMGCCFIIHAPSAIDEFELAILNKSGNLKIISRRKY